MALERVMDEEKLIEAVRMFPCLWNVTSRAFKDSKAKENAWKSVASQVSVQDMFCSRCHAAHQDNASVLVG